MPAEDMRGSTERSSRIRSAAGLALTGFSIALWTSAAHLAVVAIVRAVMTETYWHWSARDVLWIVPLGYLVIFAVPIVLLSILHAAVPGLAARHRIVGLWGGIGLFAVLLLYAGAHSWALALLSLGAGIQLARVYRAREAAVAKVFRSGALAFATFFAVFGGGSAIWRARTEQRTIGALLPSSASPNVLLIILDTVRASSMSLYGALRPTTPRLAALAERGVTFNHAFAPSPWTLPSHASMFTGVYPSEHSGDWTSRLDGQHPTLAEVFSAHGYATGGFSANQNAGSYDAGLGRGFITYRDTKRNLAEVLANTTITQGDVVVNALAVYRRDRWLGGVLRQVGRFNFRPGMWGTVHDHKSAPEVVEQFLDWQSSLGGRPFFAFLNLFDAHAPGRIPARYRLMFAPPTGGSRSDAYDGALRYLDDQVYDMLKELERRGVFQNTIVIIASDHGEHLGNHQLTGHGNSLYRELLHVPLIIINADSAAAGRRVATQVSLRDVAATSLDLAGLPPMLPGRSVAAHWRVKGGESSPVVAQVSQGIREDPKHPNAKGDMAAVVDDSLHIIRNGDGSFEAYAYRTDATEAHNLVNAATLPTFRARFAQLYQRALSRD